MEKKKSLNTGGLLLSYPFDTPTKRASKKNFLFSQFLSFFQQFVAVNNGQPPVQLSCKIKYNQKLFQQGIYLLKVLRISPNLIFLDGFKFTAEALFNIFTKMLNSYLQAHCSPASGIERINKTVRKPNIRCINL